MIDVPPAIIHPMIITGQLMAVTLPMDGKGSPIVVIPMQKQTVDVYAPTGTKLVEKLAEGDKAKFEFKLPKWWQFWRSPGWVLAERIDGAH